MKLITDPFTEKLLANCRAQRAAMNNGEEVQKFELPAKPQFGW